MVLIFMEVIRVLSLSVMIESNSRGGVEPPKAWASFTTESGCPTKLNMS